MEIKNLVDKYIEQIDDNISKISFSEEEKKDINKQIVLAKSKFNDSLTLDDLYLIRIVKEDFFPNNLVYYPIDERNGYQHIANPFRRIIGYSAYGMDEYKDIDIGGKVLKSDYYDIDLVSHLYRDTKHFTINGLASNIRYFLGISKFNNGDMVIVEPLKNKIDDKRLVILNPVDTFFDLHEKEMEIGEDAHFLIREDVFLKLDSKTLNNLKNKKIFLFEDDASVATDILLMHLNVLPQHSYQQSELREEIEMINNGWISDFRYLNKFKNLIEQLNQKYLGMSYLNVPEDVNLFRKNHDQMMVGVPGVLHSETEYFADERQKTMAYKLKTYQEYINLIINKTKNVDRAVANKIYESVKNDVLHTGILPVEEYFDSTYERYEKLLLNILQDLTIPNFKNYTDNYNRQKVLKMDRNRIG